MTCHGGDDCLDIENGRQPNSDCIECHMPERRAEDAIHLTMTDHKISRRFKDDLLAELEEEVVASEHPVKIYSWFRDSEKSIRPIDEVSRSVTRLRDEDMSPARALYNQIRGGVTEADEPKMELAEALLAMGEGGGALELLNGISESGKENSLIQSNFGLAYIQLRRFDQAILHLEKAIRNKPVVAEAHFNLGIAYINSGNRERAIVQFEKAVELKPNLASGWFTLASALSDDEKFELAEKHFVQALKIDPDYPGAHLSLAKIQGQEGKWLDSIRTLEDGQLSKPKDAVIAKELGLTMLEAASQNLAEETKTIQAVRSFIRLAKSDNESKLMLAVALLQNDRSEEALHALGDMDETELNPDRLLVAAIGWKKIKRIEEAEKFANLAKQQLDKKSQSRSRLRSLIQKMSEHVDVIQK